MTDKITHRLFVVAAATVMSAAVFSMVALSAAQAGEWKPKQVTIVLPHSLGGGQDRLTRVLVKVWAKKLGTKLKVLNDRRPLSQCA